MRSEVTPHTLREIAEDYERAIQWVQQAGFPVERGRLAEYRKIIETLSANIQTDGWGDLDNPVHRDSVCTALLEIRELVSIFKGLSGVDAPAAVAGLRHYLKGPVLPTNEDPASASNRPRNLGFELYLNALFAYAGLTPTYGNTADLTFVCSGRCFFVEAKRPLSAPAAETAIRVAKRQLIARLDSNGNGRAFGLVALDLSKVINPENKVMPVSGEAHLYNLMHAEDKRQMRLLSGELLRGAHPRVMGVLLHYRMLTNFTQTGDINTLKWLGWVPFSEEPSLFEINAKLEKVVRLIC